MQNCLKLCLRKCRCTFAANKDWAILDKIWIESKWLPPTNILDPHLCPEINATAIIMIIGQITCAAKHSANSPVSFRVIMMIMAAFEVFLSLLIYWVKPCKRCLNYPGAFTMLFVQARINKFTRESISPQGP